MTKLGTGERFAKLRERLGKREGVKSPGALAAWIGRKKYGKERFANLSSAGRRKSVAKRAASRAMGSRY